MASVRNRSAQLVVIGLTDYSKNEDPRKAKAQEFQVAPGQIVSPIPEAWTKHPHWSALIQEQVPPNNADGTPPAELTRAAGPLVVEV